MVDSNNASHAVQEENVYLSEGSEYYIAPTPKQPGDSRIPFPSPGLVSIIKSSESGKVASSLVADVVGTFGNSAVSVENYPKMYKYLKEAEQFVEKEFLAIEHDLGFGSGAAEGPEQRETSSVVEPTTTDTSKEPEPTTTTESVAEDKKPEEQVGSAAAGSFSAAPTTDTQTASVTNSGLAAVEPTGMEKLASIEEKIAPVPAPEEGDKK